MRYFLPDLSEADRPYPEGVEPGSVGDGYTEHPTHLRVYSEDCGDEWPWHIDGIDANGNYTEAVERYASENEAMGARERFVREFFPAEASHERRD